MSSWLPKKLVVVPLSFTEESFEPLDVGLSMVDDPSHVHLIHILPKLSSMEPGAMWGDVTNEKRIEKTTVEIKKKLTTAGEKYQQCRIIVRIGQTAPGIAKYAKEISAELIVLTSKGHSKAHNFFLGSTADNVFYEVHCPVLILKK